MLLNLDNTRLRTLIPNIIHEVEEETPLYEKLQPWLETARLWLETEVLGSYNPTDYIYTLSEKIIVYKAFALAVPSLDLTLSPSGFAVINTDGGAPASKERVERLIASLETFVDANIEVLLFSIHKLPEWAESPIGQWFRATFIPEFAPVSRFRRDKNLLTTYKEMRDIAIRFEQQVAESYLGFKFLEHLRSFYPKLENPGIRSIYFDIRNAELRYISFHLRDQKAKCPLEHEIWHLARPIIAQLNYYPELKARWEDEMGETLKVEQFKNTVKGGYFF